MQFEPYWWEAAPPETLPETPISPECDVAIIGGGYTGLSAAITLARAGRSVQVLDKMRPGEGASTRNGGIASGNLRPTFQQMIDKFGLDRARAIQGEAKAAREDLAAFIAREKIDCDFRHTGRFSGASAPKDYESLAREAELLTKHLKIEAYAIPRSEQRQALGTDFYYGGMFRNDIGGLHPAKLVKGMLALARGAGAIIHGGTTVIAHGKDGERFRVITSRGETRCRDVIIATNGYSDASDRWLRKRLVPVASRIIATKPLSDNLMKELMPKGYMISDSRKLHYYYRPSPDGRRILFGGRDGAIRGEQPGATDIIRRAMVDVFPVLEDTEITHSWFGYVAFNRDLIPRIFERDGVHYACGYCGSGVVWARWAGQKVAWKVLGQPEGQSALDFRPPVAVPLYNGTPWFMPAAFAWMNFQDSMAKRNRGKRKAG